MTNYRLKLLFTYAFSGKSVKFYVLTARVICIVEIIVCDAKQIILNNAEIMAANSLKVQFVNGEIVFQSEIDNLCNNVENNLVLDGAVQVDKNDQIQFVPNTIDQGFDAFIGRFIEKTTSLGLSNKNVKQMVSLCAELIEMYSKLFENIFKKKQNKNIDMNTKNALQAATEYSSEKLKKVESEHLRKVFFQNSQYYVEPEEKAMCLKWSVQRIPNKDLHFDKMKQGTFQLVPISKTLQALFSNAEFKQLFYDYNKNKEPCIKDVYKGYCCGKAFKNSSFFQSNQPLVHIQIGFDEFEPCDALKSKATIHKMLGIYFKILNMPPKYLSKLNNIFLVSLCESEHYKSSGCSVDDIFAEIVDDLKSLENRGINVDNICIRAGVPSVCSDNLGANQVLGFPESFSALFFCRKCTMHKKDTKVSTKEDPKKLRKISEYNERIKEIKENPDIDIKDTNGIRKDCVLNKLSSYHVLNNPTMDAMHDMNEGVILFFLENFFEYCILHKICSEDNLVRRIRDHNYGYLNSRNKPSKLKVNRGNLGQNATQIYCIFKHLPFIFFDKRDELKNLWPIMLSLSKIVSIAYSRKIRESDICILEKHVNKHLSGFKTNFKKPLKPKHHNLTHFPNQIREMGPFVDSTMAHYEAKHSVFKNIARKTKNFVNIAKSLAEKHQQIMCGNVHSFKDEISVSPKSYPLTKCCEFAKYRNHLIAFDNISDYVVVDFVKVNGYVYRKGIMLVENFKVFEIIYVLRYQNEYYFLCQSYDFMKYEIPLHSIKIKKTEISETNIKFFKISDLKNNQPFEKKLCNNFIYLYVENLSIYNKFK